MVLVTMLHLINALLKLAKVQLKILVDLAHLQILLLKVLSALIGTCELFG